MKKICCALMVMASCWLSAQNNPGWDFQVVWSNDSTSIDSVSSLVIRITNVIQTSNVQKLDLKVSDPNDNVVFSDTIIIPTDCLSAPEEPSCPIQILPVKSGFYKYEARLVYNDQTLSPVIIKDNTL